MSAWAYYNEIDDYAADWIENLIRAGVVAPGIVDRRSIEDVRPDDLRGFRQCHFFAGIAVWSYALRRAGIPDDVALWTGSCPCQPFSAAGKNGGVDDERHLWPAFFHLIDSCRPPRVYGEQVASKDGLGWLDLVQTDLEGADYSVWAVDTCSAGSGAPHIRQRLRFCADYHGSSAGGVWNTSLWRERGRIWERGSSQRHEESVGGHGSVDRLDNSVSEGLEGLGDRYCSATGQWQESFRPVATSSGIDWLADDERNERRTFSVCGLREVCSKERAGWSAEFAGSCRNHEYGQPGPTNGFWRDADWLFCRDGKWRPVVASHVEMVDGVTSNMGRSGPVSEEESETRLQAMLDTFGEMATSGFLSTR